MPAPKDITNQRFGRLISMKRIAQPYTATRYMCLCDCGNEKLINGKHLTSGAVRSCGCLRKEVTGNMSRVHGLRLHPLYDTYNNMMARCYNKKTPNYYNYGGRGITVCDKWKGSPHAFFDDMGVKPDGLTLERKKNNDGYGPDNCYWASYDEQSRNTRKNRNITFNGKTMCREDWAKEIGITSQALRYRIKNWTLEREMLSEKINTNGY